jgi:2-polyprenyl-6-methoxyphenol hydroxylase-like FAD-dependent oxidoreductase
MEAVGLHSPHESGGFRGFLAVPRADAERHGADVRFNTGLVELNQDRDGVIARVRNRSTGLEDTVRAQYLIGADGTQSVVREADINGTLVPRGDGRWLMFDAALDRLQVRSPANDTTMHVSRR